MIRFFDVLFSFVGLFVLSPLFIPISILLFFTGEHKIFYKQNRVGKNGRVFGILKFATMLENSPHLEGGDITSGNDPRVLPVGKFLRKTKMNELPQLLNILCGDISIVGPRPLTPRNFDFYDDQTQEIIKRLKPGLTGIGSIVFRDEESIIKKSTKSPIECYIEDISPYKGKLEKWFYAKQSISVYFILIFLTIISVLFPSSTLAWKIFRDLPTPSKNLFKKGK